LGRPILPSYEIPPTKLRGTTIAFASAAHLFVNFIAVVTIPYAIDVDEGNLRGKLAFVYVGICIPCIAYCWFYLPETKGRTYEELDLMFERKIKTRDFAAYRFEDDVHKCGEA
jgi:MFS transporter, SP family, general alpha glucoside:H+ symporter